MSAFLMHFTDNTVMASISMTIVDELIQGALAGIVIGLFVGAIVMPVLQAPDSMLRGIIFAIFAALGMALFQLARVAQVTGHGMGTVLGSFAGPYTGNLGSMIWNGIVWVLYSLLAGAIVGVGSVVPDKVLKGGLVGMFLGAFVSAALRILFQEMGIVLNITLTRIMIAALTWALFTTLVSGKD